MRDDNNLINLTYGPKENPRSGTKTIDPDSFLKILTWNIESGGSKIHGRKSDNRNFKDILDRADILCLQETKGDMEGTKSYTAFNNSRTDDQVNGKSGGVSIMVRKSMKKYVKLYHKGKHDIIAVIVNKKLSKGTKDLVVISYYSSPTNSVYCKNTPNYDPISELMDLIINKQTTTTTTTKSL